jgi:hypothetical protein
VLLAVPILPVPLTRLMMSTGATQANPTADASGPALPFAASPASELISIPVPDVVPSTYHTGARAHTPTFSLTRDRTRVLGGVIASSPSPPPFSPSMLGRMAADEVIPTWRLLQENRLMMEAATSLVADRALAVTLSGTPANPPRALAFQMQKRLGLMSLPKVELVMPGMAVAVMSNVEDYLAVTANPTLKLCASTLPARHARTQARFARTHAQEGSLHAALMLAFARAARLKAAASKARPAPSRPCPSVVPCLQTAQLLASTATRTGWYWAKARVFEACVCVSSCGVPVAGFAPAV